jgi:UDPglucose 6-dehydrogenase
MPEALVLGDWHLATVAIAGLLELGYTVHARPDHVDTPDAEEATAGLLGGTRAAAEPEVADVLARGLAENRLRPVSADRLARTATYVDVNLVAYDSLTDADGSAIDERPAATATALLRIPSRTGPVVLLSQVRAGTGDAVLVRAGLAADSADLVHLPENLRLGQSLRDFLEPHRLVVGCNGPLSPTVGQLVELLKPVRLCSMTLVEAELVKHGTNVYLAACITLANAIGAIAGRLGADPATVMDGVRADARIADTAPMRPGEPYAGATLQRDVRALWEHGEPIGRDGLFRAISSANAVHALAPVAVLDRRLDGLDGRRVCLLGLTYKPGVSTLRDSPGLRLAHGLIAHGAEVSVYDPVADEFAMPGITRHTTLRDAAADAECLVLVVEHEAFTDPAALADLRPRNRLLLRLTGRESHSRVPSPAGWVSVDPWRE